MSRVAAEFLDNVYALPVVNLRSVSTRLYASSKPLQHQRTLRMRLCRLKDSLEAFPEINSLLRRDLGSSCVYMAESADMYSLDDVARAADGDFVRPLEAAIASLKSFAELRSVVCERCVWEFVGGVADWLPFRRLFAEYCTGSCGDERPNRVITCCVCEMTKNSLAPHLGVSFGDAFPFCVCVCRGWHPT